MKTLAVVYAYKPTGLANHAIEGQTSDRWVEAMLRHAGLDDIVWLESQSQPAPKTWKEGRHWETFSGLRAVELVAKLQSLSVGYDEVVFVYADAPLLRAELCLSLLDLHRRYHAEYTFSDGYPLGLTPEIFSPRILPVLKQWADKNEIPLNRETIFQLLSIDINQFDIETDLSPVDLRLRRLSFTADTARNILLVERYFKDRELPLQEFLETVRDSSGRQRTLPATLLLQITNGVNQAPLWSPLLSFQPNALYQRTFLDRKDWNRILDAALEFSGDVTVMPSLWGEPALHPEVEDLFDDALKKDGLSLVVETSGLGWGEQKLRSFKEKWGNRIDWIVELDSNDPEKYQSLRGPGFEEAQQTTKLLTELFPGRVWPQIVRMIDNEDEMESFYRYWKEKAGQVIVQKYNDYGGRLPSKKVADLSPWKRHPCWHLQRDLAVLLDGTVLICRDDYHKTLSLGNILQEPLNRIWERGIPIFEKHRLEDYPDVCRNCDEYYTFHF